MTITLDLAARIERLYTVEHWRVGTIARQLHVHRDTVRRVLREHDAVAPGVPLRRYLVDPYRPFILQPLQKYRKRSANPIFPADPEPANLVSTATTKGTKWIWIGNGWSGAWSRWWPTGRRA